MKTSVKTGGGGGGREGRGGQAGGLAPAHGPPSLPLKTLAFPHPPHSTDLWAFKRGRRSLRCGHRKTTLPRYPELASFFHVPHV